MSDRRVVPKERGEKIAIDHGIRFVETSAKANINIDKAFFELAEAVLDKVTLFSVLFILPYKLIIYLLINRRCQRGILKQTSSKSGHCTIMKAAHQRLRAAILKL
jgi:hypothetical protein